MHAVVYQHRPDAGAVVHTHSPAATSFAVASQPVPVIYEAQLRFNMTAGIPVAGYGPRGSQLAVDNIAAVLKAHEGARALLLENHGVLAYAGDAAGATRAAIIVEETASLMLNARVLGGAKPIPPELYAMTQDRAREFERQGPLTAAQTARPEAR
jgi:L-fuculose-phosphate aldolase